MFLGEPHITTKNFRALKERVGVDVFRETDRMEPYYVAALTLYRGERLFQSGKLDARFKPARYQILLAVRLLMDRERLPAMNSYAMEKRCEKMIKVLSDEAQVEKLFAEAARIVESVAGKGWDRDSIRTESVTKGIFAALGQSYERRRKDEAAIEADRL
jgi:hypothetical protein